MPQRLSAANSPPSGRGSGSARSAEETAAHEDGAEPDAQARARAGRRGSAPNPRAHGNRAAGGGKPESCRSWTVRLVEDVEDRVFAAGSAQAFRGGGPRGAAG